MDIQFCDLCNESIPVSHINGGKAFRHAGRLICVACDKAMGGGGDPDATLQDDSGSKGAGAADRAGGKQDHGIPVDAPKALSEPVTRRSGGSAGIAVGLLALLVAGSGLVLLMERLESNEQHWLALDQAREQGERDWIQQAADRDARLDAQLAATREQSMAQVAELGGKFEQVFQDIGEREQEHGAILAELGSQLGQLRGEISSEGSELGKRVGALSDSVEKLRVDQGFYADRLSQLDEQLRGVLTMRPVALAAIDPTAASAAPGADQGTAAPWASLVQDLDHGEAGIRMDTVYELAETGDKRVVPHLVPMLSDADLFVRMATARSLMDLDGRAGVPALIDTLSDASGAVRDAAVVALRRITGREFGFVPLASEAERSKRIKAWRDWWKKAGDDFLAA